MKNLLNWIRNNPNRAMFLVPILLVAGISISHVVTWYDMANPISWAIYLSIAIEIAAITALVAATNRIKGGIWFMFGLVTFIQMVGNIFYSYKEIDPDGELFKSWIELTGPVWELMGTETTDIVGMKRWLAFLEGGLLPVISLTSLHFFVKYQKNEDDVIEEVEKKNEKTDELETPSKDDYNNLIEEKRLKLEEDKKVFEPLLSSLYENGKIGKGEVLPTYIEFRKDIEPEYTDDNIKMFLTLCNYLDITELSDNVRKSKVNFNEATTILSKYLTLETLENIKPEETKEKKQNQDWWTSPKRKG